MANLFNIKEYSRAEKMRIARDLTNKLTREAINYLNSTGQFKVHRQNNIPSTRLANEDKEIEGKLIVNGVVTDQVVKVMANIPVVYHKKGQKEVALLDIAGFSLPIGDDPGGLHVELEVKRGSDTLKDDQAERIKEVTKSGGISFVFTSMEDLKIKIKPFLRQRPPAF